MLGEERRIDMDGINNNQKKKKKENRMTPTIDLTAAMQTPDTAGKRNCEGLKREGVVGE